MRALLVATTAVGLLLGAGVAVAWHYFRLAHGGWVAYSPVGAQPFDLAFTQAAWWPVGLVAPVVGAALGLGAGRLLVRRGWRLQRVG